MDIARKNLIPPFLVLALFGIGWGSGNMLFGGSQNRALSKSHASPSAPASMVSGVTNTTRNDRSLEGLLHSLASAPASSMQQMFESLHTLPWDERKRRQPIVVARWVSIDLERARRYFDTLEGSLRNPFYEQWAIIDPAAAIAGMDGSTRISVLKGVAASAPELCLAQLEDLGSEVSYLHKVYHILARTHPQEAAELADRNGLDWRVKQSIADTWAHDNPEAAVRWALLQRQAHRAEATMKIWAEVDHRGLAGLVATLDLSSERDLGSSLVFKHWSATEPETAIAWLESNVLEGKWVTHYRRALAESGTHDLRNTMTLLDRMPEKGWTNLSLSSVGSYWGTSDPQHVMDWMAETPPAERLAETKLLHGFAYGWAANAPGEAIGFADKIPEGTLRQNYIDGLLASLDYSNPHRASALREQLAGGSSS